jgi:hypothetical protein
MAASTKKQAKTSGQATEILKGLEEQHGRVFLKHAKKFASFPELLGMQEK